MLAVPVALKPSMDTKDHDDAPISEIAAPKTLQRAPFANYPTPLPLLDYYNGECLDKGYSLDSEDQQPKFTPAWCKNDSDSYGSYYPKDKMISCERPPTIKSEDT